MPKQNTPTTTRTQQQGGGYHFGLEIGTGMAHGFTQNFKWPQGGQAAGLGNQPKRANTSATKRGGRNKSSGQT